MYVGEKVRLREYRREDIPKAQAYLNNPGLRKLLSGPPFPYTFWDEEKWILGQSVRNDLYNFAIESLEDGHYIGGCGLNQLDWRHRVCEVGIFIGDEAYQNRGYGTDAMRVLLKIVFGELNMNKASLSVLDFNARAIKVYQRLGFKEEGRLRQERYLDGKYHDLVLMGLLREEYEQIQGK